MNNPKPTLASNDVAWTFVRTIQSHCAQCRDALQRFEEQVWRWSL